MKEKKYFIITDVHGDLYSLTSAKKAFIVEKADVFVSLGDIFYHGPRNPLPNSYSPMSVNEELLSITAPKIFIKGNCDAEIDEMIAKSKFKKSVSVVSGGKKVVFTHGHEIEKALSRCKTATAVIYGHFHKNEFREEGKIKYINLASVSIPKEGNQKSYAILYNGTITVKNVENGDIISQTEL